MTLQIEGWSLSPAGVGSAAHTRLPQQWWPIAESADPADRRTAALALWPRAFLDLVPVFAGRLADHLTDVRAYLSDTGPVLLYEADHATWIGSDPRGFTAPAQFWNRLPRLAREFQREVHAAFTAPNGQSYGLMHPAHLRTIAEIARRPAGIPGWDDTAAAQPGGRIASNRLLPITRDSGNLWMCVSPDLPEGQVAMVYEGDVGPEDFASAFDQLLSQAFEGS
jgi:hypothetical protein